MAVQINWALAHPAPDFSQGAIDSFQAGQAAGKQQAARNALARYATDPQGSIAAMTAVDPVAASQLRQGYVADQTLQRQQQFRAALAKGDMQGATRAAAGDPQLMQAMDQMHARMKALNDAQAAGLQAVSGVPQEQRAQVWDSTVAPRLVALGMDPSKVSSGGGQVDFSDQGIKAAVAQTMTAKDQLDLGMKQATQAETVRHNQATETQQQNQLAETSRHNQAAETTSRMEAGAAVSNARTNAQKLTLMQNGGGIDPDVIEFYAQRNAQDGYLPNMGYGAAAAGVKAAILARSAQLQRGQGQTGADMAANVAGFKANAGTLSQLTKQRGQINNAEQTAIKNADLALQIATAGGSGPATPVFNGPIQKLRGNVLGDPKVSQFNAALGTFRDEYANVMTGGGSRGSTDSARRDADERINTAMSLPQLRATIQTMKAEMANRSASYDQQIADLHGQLNGHGTPAAQAPANRPSLDQIFGSH